MKRAKKGLAAKCREAIKALLTRQIEFRFEQLPVVIPNASYGRIFNWLLAEMSALRNTAEPWGKPTHVQIETSSKCNHRCSYCPVTQEKAAATGHMDYETFRKFAGELGDKPLLYQLWGWGEPFLNPAIFDMIRYARQRNIRTISSTNGELFERPELAEQLVESGLDILIVAVSGVSQETYGAYRPLSQVSRVFDGVRNIVAAKRRLGKQNPLVSLTVVITKANEHEVPRLREIGEELGVDAVTIKSLNPASTQGPGWNGDAHIASDPSLVRLVYEEGARVRTKRNPCKHLWQGTTLRWNGTVNPCPYDFHGVRTLGDSRKSEFVQIWTGEAYRDMRRAFREDWNKIPICENCTYAFEGGSHNEAFVETLWIQRQGTA
jgi:MoaA/NifB/PqqE/SkfB family radical SAM enzyme